LSVETAEGNAGTEVEFEQAVDIPLNPNPYIHDPQAGRDAFHENAAIE
jgi:hypothetical protein